MSKVWGFSHFTPHPRSHHRCRAPEWSPCLCHRWSSKSQWTWQWVEPSRNDGEISAQLRPKMETEPKKRQVRKCQQKFAQMDVNYLVLNTLTSEPFWWPTAATVNWATARIPGGFLDRQLAHRPQPHRDLNDWNVTSGAVSSAVPWVMTNRFQTLQLPCCNVICRSICQT